MTASRTARLAWAAVAATALLAASAVAGAAEPGQAGVGHHQIQIDGGLLDAYAGYYLLGEKAVLTVKRDGDHLSIELTGQPPTPVLAESRTGFFATEVDAQLAFQTAADGKVVGLVLHQHGASLQAPRIDAARAQQIESSTAAKVQAQKATPGTAQAARRLDASIAAGAPDYPAMAPGLATAVRGQLPRLQSYLAGLGPIQDVRFLGVDPQGGDVYDIRHAKGVARWTVVLAADGKLAGAYVMQGP